NLALAAVLAEEDAVLARLVRRERDVAHGGAARDADAAPRGLRGEKILEDAAVDLVARHRQRPARADLGDGVDVAAAVGREEAKAELLQLRRLEMLLQAEHLGEV